MKIITIQQVGFNHPSQANWSWGVFSVGLVDTSREYNMSHTVKEAFGGNTRLVELLRELKIPVVELRAVYTNKTPVITGVAKCWDMEGVEILKEITDFINK